MNRLGAFVRDMIVAATAIGIMAATTSQRPADSQPLSEIESTPRSAPTVETVAKPSQTEFPFGRWG